jgi:hypothetical protein
MRIRIRFWIHLINLLADPDAYPEFYLMRMRIPMRIQVIEMMRTLADPGPYPDPDPKHW